MMVNKVGNKRPRSMSTDAKTCLCTCGTNQMISSAIVRLHEGTLGSCVFIIGHAHNESTIL
jgi:hypothetical protein